MSAHKCRPDLWEVMRHCDHVATGVLEAAEARSPALLLVKEVEGEKVAFVVREEPSCGVHFSMYYYSREEIEALAYRFAGRRLN
jgi:hypothetical protein